MNRKITLALMLTWLIASARIVTAQDATAPADPAATEPAAAPQQPTSSIPAVLAIIETKPTTVPELFRAAEIVTDLGDLPVAKDFLAKLLAASPSDEKLAELWEKLGTARFVRLKNIAALNPEATELSNKVQAAAEKWATDPARLDGLLKSLQSPEPDDQRAAIELLRTGRGAAVNALLKVLADPAQQADHAGARRAIIALGDDAFGPLLAALDTSDVALRAQVAVCLAALPREEGYWYLIAPALAADSPASVSVPALEAISKRIGHTPTVTEGAAILFNRAQAYYDRRVLLGQSERTNVEIWTWDAAAGQAVKQEYTARDAGLHYARRLAADARRLAPQEQSVQTLYFGALLEAEQSRVGVANPLPDGPGTALDELKQAGVATVNALLLESLRNGHAAAAANAVRVLGDLGDASILQGTNGRPSPLADALLSDDRRVRYMAVRSILKLDPKESFPGSSFVTKALGSFLSTAGEPRAVVAGPNLAEDQRLAGLLLESGYAAEGVDVLGDVQRALSANSDSELLLLDIRFAAQTSGELIARIRRDPRTAKLPIGIVYSPYDRANPAPLDNAGGIAVTPDDQQLAEALARRFARVQPIIRPQEAASLTAQLDWILSAPTNHAVPKEERLAQAKFALAWVRRIAEQRSKVYAVAQLEPAVRALLPFEPYTDDVAATLVALGTATGQRDLVNLASAPTLPLAQRAIAAKAFSESIARHGILLTTQEIQLQYDRYNASESADAETQQLLNGILDALENAKKE